MRWRRAAGGALALALALACAPAAAGPDAGPVLRGVVIGPDRRPVAGARVSIEIGDRNPDTARSGTAAPGVRVPVTDLEGAFQFDSLPAGEWVLVCEAEGFVPWRARLRIRADESGAAMPAPDLVIRLRRLDSGAGEEETAVARRLRDRRDAFERDGGPGAGTLELYTGVPMDDRWRIPVPEPERYPGLEILDAPGRPEQQGEAGEREAPGTGARWNPYRKNLLKGDLPIAGQNTFLVLSGLSDSFIEARTLPTPSGASAAQPGADEFFGERRQYQAAQTALVSAELFHGNAGFRPVDWRVRATAGGQFNWLAVRERGVVNVDVREGTDRTDEHGGIQEAFAEVKLADLGARYDFVSLRAGVQPFISDSRGFLFVDNQPGVRLFGSLFANRLQWNAAVFEMLEKDTNSGLNTTHRRHQRVGVANLSWQDAFVHGYTLAGSVHVSDDSAGSDDTGGFHYDENGFLVRPAPVGDFLPHDLRVTWYGLAGDGHIGRLNLTHQVYFADGREDHNPIADRPVQVRALMAAAEASWDRDWFRVRAHALYAGGDEEPADGVGQGFDAIVDNPNFAGGPFSFWNRQAIRLAGSGLSLTGRFSLLTTLRSSKEEGQANFVNPGIFLAGAGADFDLTPKLRLVAAGNYLRFDNTSSLETVLFQEGIRKPIGFDLSLGAVWRPWLNDNVIVTGGAAVFRPSSGFRDLLVDRTLASAFASLTLTY